VVASLAQDFQKLATLLLRALASSLRMYMLELYLHLGIYMFFQFVLFLLLLPFIRNYFITLLPSSLYQVSISITNAVKLTALQVSHYTEMELVFPSVMSITHCRKRAFQTKVVDTDFGLYQVLYDGPFFKK
jgi:hypothetical protein